MKYLISIILIQAGDSVEEKERRGRKGFSLCFSVREMANRSFLSSSFLKPTEMLVDCHSLKRRPDKAIQGAECRRHLFFFSISSFFSPFSILVIKFEQNQMEGGVSMKVPFVGLKRASNLQTALPLCGRLKEKRNQ